MAENMQKIKLLKLYELLRRDTDEDHPISRRKLCRRLNEMGISSNVRTLSLDIQTLTDNGYEVMSFMRDKERFFYVPERELTLPEIKILIDALQAASFVTEKKTTELMDARLALREDREQCAVSALKESYGMEYEPDLTKQARRNVGELLNEPKPDEKLRSVRKRLQEKQAEVDQWERTNLKMKEKDWER